ncbi:YheV family putative zinc ribbon protein [Gilvimarinus agarilyticus]|uniref:YheV family putative zinc ribbon protein n=1 Tax=Gilvimarinus agarilyticus TaxID=679259 RepID=UPI0005A14717|nr:YheV family putative zinc ribbon protein [Gilvimarinus agarilyticus]
MSTYSTTKRFLAGAICPRCEAADAIVVYSRDERDFRECVDCGFIDEMHFAPQAQELDTRVSESAEDTSDEQVVKILSFPSGSSR